MKRLIATIFVLTGLSPFAHAAEYAIPRETEAARQARMAWWTNDRFGMFIHFGLYSAAARHEWVKNYEAIPDEVYDAKYFRHFNPKRLDAKAWAQAAKQAGMKYAVLTTKHHEGFCLWDSKFTDYKVTKTPFGRDVVREFVDAFRAEGLKVGFYYSLLDWHHPDYAVDLVSHPRKGLSWELYEQLRTGPEPEKALKPYFDAAAKLNVGRDMARYRKYMRDQITELLTPEQINTAKCLTVGGRNVPWETCQTFSGSWGYHRDEQTWKSPHQLIVQLVKTVSCGGNLITNVGPTGRGCRPMRSE